MSVEFIDEKADSKNKIMLNVSLTYFPNVSISCILSLYAKIPKNILNIKSEAPSSLNSEA